MGWSLGRDAAFFRLPRGVQPSGRRGASDRAKFFTAVSLEALPDEQAMGGNAHGRVMMDAAATPPFIMRARTPA